MSSDEPARRQRVFLFPLGTVLFPGGVLPLKIFEQRYLEMTKACLRDETPFGVCLIREGSEVGTPAAPFTVGCLARIEQWDMPQPNLFHLVARGAGRFRILATTVADNGLISGEVELLPDAAPCAADPDCAALLKRVLDEIGDRQALQSARLDDGVWVAYRLAEMIQMPMAMKQGLLEAPTVDAWLDNIKNIIKSNI
jgi:Lon protease-like protein